MILLILSLFLLTLAQGRNERFLSIFMDQGMDRVDYLLFTPEKDPFKFKIDVKTKKLVKNGFKASRHTKIIAHGFLNEGDSFCADFSQAYFATKMDVNILCIDWEKLASGGYFVGAAKNSIKVGKHVGRKLILRKLIFQLGQKPELIHVIGYSLGAHLAGHLGRTVFKKINRKIGRITGLDPASPDFPMYETNHLFKTDAQFVDVIHTNSGDLLDGCLGIFEPLGHVDFYPNGGIHQPGCQSNRDCSGFWGFFRCLGGLIDIFKGACSHGKSYYMYLDSIKHRNVQGYLQSVQCQSYEAFTDGQCDSNLKIPMGEASHDFAKYLDDKKDQKFFLVTKESAPFMFNASIKHA